jgi:hypothetical protein
MSARSSSARFRSSQQRQRLSFPEAIERLRGGSLLRLEYDRAKPAWTLDDKPISPEIVTLLLSCSEVEAADAGLFDGAAGQTWRMREA